MSAQHQHRSFKEWFCSVFLKKQSSRAEFVWHRYPQPVFPTMAAGHGHRMVQPTGPLQSVVTMQQAIPFDQLGIEQLNRLASRIDPVIISQIPTAKNLSPEQLPLHVQQKHADVPQASGKLPGIEETRRHLSAPKLQAIPPQQVSCPLPNPVGPPAWMKELVPPGHAPGALPIERTPAPLPPIVPDINLPRPGQCTDAFLLDRQSQALDLTEEEMRPDLTAEDDEETMLRPRVKKDEESE